MGYPLPPVVRGPLRQYVLSQLLPSLKLHRLLLQLPPVEEGRRLLQDHRRHRCSSQVWCFGLISIVFFDTIYDVMELSLSACAFMMRSMFADHPCSEVVKTHGESAIRLLTTTFSVLSPPC